MPDQYVQLDAALQHPRTKLVWIETPANPTWYVIPCVFSYGVRALALVRALSLSPLISLSLSFFPLRALSFSLPFPVSLSVSIFLPLSPPLSLSRFHSLSFPLLLSRSLCLSLALSFTLSAQDVRNLTLVVHELSNCLLFGIAW